MKKVLLLIFILAGSSWASAEERGAISWSQLKKERKLKVGFVIEPDATTGFEQLKLTARPGPITLATIETPEISRTGFAMSGQVKCQGLTQYGTLELVAHYPGGRTYCMQAVGPNLLALNLYGSSDWTRFSFWYFMSSNSKPKPERFDVRINVPGEGIVYLSPLRFSEFDKSEPDQATRSNVRIVFLIFLAVVLVLTLTFRWTVSRYRPGKWTFAFIIPMTLLGGLLLLMGVTALRVTGQFTDFAPFIFLGAAEVLLPWVLKARAKMRYQ